MRGIVALALVGSLLLAGCASTSSDDGEPGLGQDSAAVQYPHVVVAVIDSAINVYHEHFRSNTTVPAALIDSFTDAAGAPPTRVTLSNTGPWEDRRDADADVWDSIESGQVYHFEGTRVMAVSFGGNIIEGGSHGTATSAAVLNANPNAIVVLVQGVAGNDGEQWAATTPWVDILSESYGLYCGQQALELVPGSSTAKNNKLAAENGKIPIGAADNTPCLAPNDGTSGPPWVVGVSGDHPAGPESSCREPVSGNLPDFTADFTQELPRDQTLDEYGFTSGTSFATPTTAGAFSRAILDVRAAWAYGGGIADGALAHGPDDRGLYPADVRQAFNATATYFGTAVSCDDSGSVPVNSAAPWVQMGWGHVDGDVGAHAGRVLLGEEAPVKPAEAVAYMEALYQYRQESWNAVA
jgi:hypothetical protein